MSCPSANYYRYDRILIAILAIAIVLRTAVFMPLASHPERFFFGNDRTNDAIGYDRLAANLIKVGTFSVEESAPYTPNFSRTPVYPLFLSAIYFIFGHKPLAVILLQIFVSVVMVLFTYLIGVRLFSHEASLIGAALLAVEPVTITYCNYLMTDTLATFFILVVTFFIIQAPFKATRAIGAGIMLGFGGLCRPISIYLWAPLHLYFLNFLSSTHWRGIALRYGVFVSAFFLVVAPWFYRNWSSGGVPVISTIHYSNLLDYRAAGVMALANNISLMEARAELSQELYRRSGGSLHEPSRSRIKRDIALEVMWTHPFETFLIALKGLGRELFHPSWPRLSHALWGRFNWEPSVTGTMATEGFWPAMELLCNRGWLGFWQVLTLLWEVLVTITIYTGALLAVLRGLRCSLWRRNVGLLLLLITYFLLLAAGPEGYARFRVPVMPYLCLMAGVGLVHVRNIRQSSSPEISQNRHNHEHNHCCL